MVGSFEEPFVGLLSGLNISLAILEHATEEPGEFMGAGVYCRRGSETNLDASDESSDGGLAQIPSSFVRGLWPEKRSR